MYDSPNSEEDLSNFKMILKICPGLKKALKGFNGDIDLLKCFIGHVSNYTHLLPRISARLLHLAGNSGQ